MEKKGFILQVGKAAPLSAGLSKQFQVEYLPETELTEQQVLKLRPDLILLCAETTAQAAMQLLTKLKEWTISGEIPVCILDYTGETHWEAAALKGGAFDYVAVPCDDDVLLWRLMRTIDSYRQFKAVRQEVVNKETQIERLSMQTLSAIANLVDSKDRFLKGHSMRVAEYACAIAEKLHCSEKEIKDIYYMGMLHDIGKIGIPDTVFTKAGRLTDSEYKLVQQHTIVGKNLLEDLTRIPHAALVAGYHHEWLDGSGYSTGLRGEEIPFDARIVNIADAYDAMNTDRSYRDRLSKDEIRQELEKGRGSQFDSQLVDIMLELMDEGFEPRKAKQMENFTISSLAEESNALLQRLFLEYTEEIKDISHKDALTGLWNRGYVESQVNAFLRTRRHVGTFMMLDLDDFKAVNDTYGHLAGDRLLIQFGAILQQLSREEDIVCRFGGDEFAVFLKDCNDEAVVRRKAERYIKTLWETLLQPNHYESTSVSIGIAMAPQHGNSFVELYQNADKALYHVKQHGKNGYHFYEASLGE